LDWKAYVDDKWRKKLGVRSMELIINLTSKMGSKQMVKHLKSNRNNIIHIESKKGQSDLSKVK